MTPKKKKVLALIISVVFLFVGYRVFIAVSNGSGEKESLVGEGVPVTIKAVETRDVNNMITMTGDIYPNVGVEIVSKVTGRIEHIKVGIGDVISKGDVIAVIEHRDKELKVREAEAALKVALADLEKARGTLEREKAEYESANTLHNNGMMSDEEYRKEKGQYLSALATVKLSEAQANDEKKAKLDIAKKDLADCWIRSPIDGIVTRQNVDIGTMVYSSGGNNSKALFTIENLKKVKVLVKVPANFSPFLKVGQSGEIEVPSMADKIFKGEITRVSPAVDQKTRSSVAILQIDNANMELMSGLFVEVRVQLETIKNALMIPRDAVFKKGNKQFVFLINGNKAVEKELETGIAEGNFIQATKGIAGTDEIIVSNKSRLYDGALVRKGIL